MIVLDSCAALEIARETDMGMGFKALMLAGESVIAPNLMHYEVSNAVLKYVRTGERTVEEGAILGHDACDIVDEYVGCEDMWDEVLSESARLGHPTYDIFYLVLARRTAGTLFTADKKLQKLCMQTGVECVYSDEEF